MSDVKLDLEPLDLEPIEESQAELDLEPLELEPLEESQEVSGLESGARGLLQGATLGFADEIAGGIESLFTDKTYEQARDESRKNFATAQEANPLTYGAGELGGGIGTMLIPGLGAAKLAKGATMGAKLAAGAKAGAKLGGLYAAGSSVEDSAAGVAGDTLKGAAGGAVLSAAMPALFGSMGRGATFADKAKKLATAGGTGAAIGAGLDLAAGGEDDLVQSALLGGTGALAAKTLLGAGRVIGDSPFGTTMGQLYRHGAEKGKSVMDKAAFDATESKYFNEVADYTKKAGQKVSDFFRQFEGNKSLLQADRELKKAGTQAKLAALADQADDAVRGTEKSLKGLFNVIEDTADSRGLKFRPAQDTEGFISKMYDPKGTSALRRLPDSEKSRIVETLRNDNFTGEVGFKDAKALKSTIDELISEYSKQGAGPVKAELAQLRSSVVDRISQDLSTQGADDLAQELGKVNKQWGALQQAKDTLSIAGDDAASLIKGRSAREKLFRRLGVDEGLFAADDLDSLARELGTEGSEVSAVLGQARNTAEALRALKARYPASQLADDAINAMDDATRAQETPIRNLVNKLKLRQTDPIRGGTSELTPDAAIRQVSDALEQQVKVSDKASQGTRLQSLLDDTRPLLGDEATDTFLKKAEPLAEELDLIRPYLKDSTTQADIGPRGLVRTAVDGADKLIGRSFNATGKVVYDTKQFAKSITNNENLQALQRRAEALGLTRLTNLFTSMAAKSSTERNALLFTLMQRPDLRQELDQLSEE